jgi:Predicted transcriptional regulator containing the HTH domain
LVNELQNKYIDYGINLVKIGNTIAFRTSEEVSGLMNIEQEISKPLSRAASETLAIIAYHQPITRTQIENIRGVSLSKGTLDQLFEIGWIKPGRKLRTPGRPMTWLTTIKFLDHFGLSDLSDLPGLDELKESGLLQHESILFSDPKDEIED